nr:hypothetical protein [Tanacetum cinerariifolium]
MVMKKVLMKRKRQMNSTETSTLTREGDYNYIKILKNLTYGVYFATASSSVALLQTSTPIMTPSTIATITIISHALIPPTTIPSKVLQNLPTFDSVFRYEDRLKSLEANFSEYIQTNPFAEAVSNILAEVLTRSSHSSRTSYAVAADLLKMELKKILIEKMEGNKSIQCLDDQRNLYKPSLTLIKPIRLFLTHMEKQSF